LKTALSNCMAKTLVVAGSRELPIMKRSAKALADRLPAARLEILKGYSHGELSLNHAEEYVAKCLKLMKE